ncbi:metal-dependent hydrolase [Solimonas sp. SE-A11]|uniref:metal-dependent hydrolase n=1 Tax=Solimonas sp. SE-A11 TaxID=3054954 RepID=UPI00259C8F01|nr:metal-dependent hydrolase [Solimonas sp. SE-A11]MDM4769781.1 metal-dependent hydrolase [Solimonas sp. SE-A11]
MGKMEQGGAATIPVRRMDFEFGDDIPTWWFDGDPVKTLIMAAQSCTFPEGERFFIRSVRAWQDGVKDPVLRQQIRGFIGQEAHHGNEHTALNAFMQGRGLPTGKVEAFVKRGLGFRDRMLSPERRLAMTCALEHFTAMLAEMLLEHPEFLKGMDERVFALWLWHAVEESEHKAVAFDVFKDQVDSEWIRRSQMVVTTLEFSLFSALHFARLYRASGEKLGLRGVMKRLAYFRPWLRQLGPRYRAYYRRDFHPDEVDSRALREAALKRLAQLLDRPTLAA